MFDYASVNTQTFKRFQNTESTATVNISKSGSCEAGKSWRCSLIDGCGAVIRWVKQNPVSSLYIAIIALGASAAEGVVLYDKETKTTSVSSSNPDGIEIPPHLLNSPFSKGVFINNTATASSSSDRISSTWHKRRVRLPAESAPRYRSKRQIQSTQKQSNSKAGNPQNLAPHIDRQPKSERNSAHQEKTSHVTRKDEGCLDHHDTLSTLKKNFSEQEKELEGILDGYFESGKKIFLTDISSPNELLSILDKLEQDIDSIMAGELAYDPRFYTELEVSSFNQYANYFSPTIDKILPNLKTRFIENANNKTMNARKEIKTITKNTNKKSRSDCFNAIRKEKRNHKNEIRNMIKNLAQDLNCFLVSTYDSDIRPRYEALKTKLNNIAQSDHWAIPTQMPELSISNECFERHSTGAMTTTPSGLSDFESFKSSFAKSMEFDTQLESLGAVLSEKSQKAYDSFEIRNKWLVKEYKTGFLFCSNVPTPDELLDSLFTKNELSTYMNGLSSWDNGALWINEGARSLQATEHDSISIKREDFLADWKTELDNRERKYINSEIEKQEAIIVSKIDTATETLVTQLEAIYKPIYEELSLERTKNCS